jgi:hypothetical protein
MLSPGEAGTRNAHQSPGNLGVKEVAAKMAEEATTAGASIARKDAESLTAEVRGTISPRAVLHHHHLVMEVDAEAEAHTPAQSPLSMGGTYETHGNI